MPQGRGWGKAWLHRAPLPGAMPISTWLHHSTALCSRAHDRCPCQPPTPTAYPIPVLAQPLCQPHQGVCPV